MYLAYTLSDCSAHTYNIVQKSTSYCLGLWSSTKTNPTNATWYNMMYIPYIIIYHGNIVVIYCSSKLLVAPEFHHVSPCFTMFHHVSPWLRRPSPSNGMAMGHGCGAVAAGRSGHGAGAVRAGRSIDTLPPMAMGYPWIPQKDPKNHILIFGVLSIKLTGNIYGWEMMGNHISQPWDSTKSFGENQMDHSSDQCAL